MDTSAITAFFRVVTKPHTWLTVLFHWLAFPLGLFYFIFLVTGLSLGVGLLVIWIGIPILLVVAGAWWLFGSFERLQARHLLGADVGPAPRSWETVDGVWAKLKAHFANGATWRDLAYLMAKLPFGVVSFTLATTAVAIVVWLAAFPLASYFDVRLISWGDGQGYIPTWWQAVLAVPAAVLAFFISLHVLNGWGWVCARWAELLFGNASAQLTATDAGVAPAQPAPLVSTPPAQPAPLVSTPPAQPDAAPAPYVTPPPAQPAAAPPQPARPAQPYQPPAQAVATPPRQAPAQEDRPEENP